MLQVQKEQLDLRGFPDHKAVQVPLVQLGKRERLAIAAPLERRVLLAPLVCRVPPDPRVLLVQQAVKDRPAQQVRAEFLVCLDPKALKVRLAFLGPQVLSDQPERLDPVA